MCGKTIAEDRIKLVIDHRVPREWGGTNDRDNLWAICEPCNIFKRDFFGTLPKSVMKKCMGHKLAVVRIGELLKVFKGEVVPRDLLKIVGMEDGWVRWLRELRDLGWKVEYVRVKGRKGAARHSYRQVKSRPWQNDVKSVITAAAAKRGAKSLG